MRLETPVRRGSAFDDASPLVGTGLKGSELWGISVTSDTLGSLIVPLLPSGQLQLEFMESM